MVEVLSALRVPLAWLAVICSIVLLGVRKADGSPMLRIEWPGILLQILNPDSRKCGFGWSLFFVATFAAFYLKKANGDPMLDSEKWLLCAGTASALMGFGTIFDKKHELEMAKLGGAVAPPAPEAAEIPKAAA